MNKQRHMIVPAAYLVLMDDTKILLLRRYNTGYEDGNYSFIAGHVDSGETFTTTMIREAKEEAGIVLRHEHLDIVHVMHRRSTFQNEERLDMFMIARTWEGSITNCEPHKCDDLHWFDIDSLPKNVILYIQHAINNIRRGVYFCEYGW